MSRCHVAGLDRALDLGDRQLGGLIEVQAPLYPGDSGAAVVNLHGDWLGLIRSGLDLPPQSDSGLHAPQAALASTAPPSSSPSEVSLGRPERDTNFGFAIPARDALWVADQLRVGGRVDRAYLGVRLECRQPAVSTSSQNQTSTVDLTSGAANRPLIATESLDYHVTNPGNATPSIREGAILREVLTGTPASQAGLQPGDCIVELDGQPIRTAYYLTDRLDRIPARATILLGIVRDRTSRPRRMSVSLCTASRPVAPQVLATGSPASSRVIDSSRITAPATIAIAPGPVQPNAPVPASSNGQRRSTLPSKSPVPDDLRLTLPRAVVDRLEKLEQRLEKLESFSTRSVGITPTPVPQVSSAQHP